jgi:hypothetical protein
VKARRALAAAGLAVFLLAEVWPLRVSPRERWAKLSRTAPLPASERPLLSTSFFFDPGYAPFLEAIRQATPPGATIALRAPRTHELYTYEASYLLAPRRLVSEERIEQAQFEAVYGEPSSRGGGTVLPVPNGILVRLR